MSSHLRRLPTPKGGLGVSIVCLIILAVGIFVYSPSIGGDWLWDDAAEVSENPILRDPSGLVKIWQGVGWADYLPVKSSLQWIYFQAAGPHPTAWHSLTLSLHLLCALLVWRLFSKLGVEPSWLGGLLFAIHPVLVVSVAWISELKNTLSLAFLLISMLAYLQFDKRPNLTAYLASVAFFCMAALSKASVVMYPLVILLYCWWRTGTLTLRDVRASMPFFLVSLAVGFITIIFQFHRAISDETLPISGFLPRLAIAGIAIPFYFSKVILPINLSPIYSRWDVDPPQTIQFLPWLFILALAILFYAKRKTWGAGVLLGTGFFVINLIPVLGFVNMSFMRASWVSDHFVYLSSIGVIGLAVAGVGWLERRFAERRVAVWGTVGAIVVFLALSAHAYARVFSGPLALWSYTVSQNPDSWNAHNGLARELVATDVDAAYFHATEAMRLKPDIANVRNNFAVVLEKLGHQSEALREYREAARLRPDKASYGINTGRLLMRLGQIEEGRAAFENAILNAPAEARYLCEYGASLYHAGLRNEAIDQYRKALAIDPGITAAQTDLEIILREKPAASAPESAR